MLNNTGKERAAKYLTAFVKAAMENEQKLGTNQYIQFEPAETAMRVFPLNPTAKDWETTLPANGFQPKVKAFVDLTDLGCMEDPDDLQEVYARLSPLLCGGSAICLHYQVADKSALAFYARLERNLSNAGFLIYEHRALPDDQYCILAVKKCK